MTEVNEKKKLPGLWANIHAKRKRIAAGSGERMRKPGEKGAPTAAALNAAQESVNLNKPGNREIGTDSLTGIYKKSTPGQVIKRVVRESLGLNAVNEAYDSLEKATEAAKKQNAPIEVWSHKGKFYLNATIYKKEHDDLKAFGAKLVKVVEQADIEEAAVDSKGHKSSTGGLTQKGRDYYNRNFGANLKAPVTKEPSKLDPKSKSAKRRKSFCARMGGMKKRLTSAKTARDPDSRINKALRKWNC